MFILKNIKVILRKFFQLPLSLRIPIYLFLAVLILFACLYFGSSWRTTHKKGEVSEIMRKPLNLSFYIPEGGLPFRKPKIIVRKRLTAADALHNSLSMFSIWLAWGVLLGVSTILAPIGALVFFVWSLITVDWGPMWGVLLSILISICKSLTHK